MRILVVHNEYLLRGGEDTVVEQEIDLLKSRGHVVEHYIQSNTQLENMSAGKAALTAFWSTKTVKDIDCILSEFKPDVVHVHNVFPLISPSIYWVAFRLNVPIIQTLHNFRLVCPQGMFIRDGKICEKCLGSIPLPAIRHACYRDNRIQSSVLVGVLSFHRLMGTWSKKISRFIVMNEFCRSKFVEAGIPAEKIAVKPHFVNKAPVFAGKQRSGLLFVGRLSPEKGLLVAIDAARTAGLTLTVIGDGPLANLVSEAPNVIWLGALPKKEVLRYMSEATAVVVPSLWYETFGMVIVEAFSVGTPVIASRIGVLPDLVLDGKNGLLFSPGIAADLTTKMLWAMSNLEEMLAMGSMAFHTYQKYFTPEENYSKLITVYRDAASSIIK